MIIAEDKKTKAIKSFLKIILSIGFVAMVVLCYLSQDLIGEIENDHYDYPLTTDAYANPLMGWAPWASAKEIPQPHSLVYADLTWREFEPQEGVFDFESFEAENQFDRWRKAGKRVVFRFVLDKPGDEPHIDIPDWLFEKIGGDGQFYDDQYGIGFSPNYANSILIEYHNRVIHALAEKYGDNDFIAYIELGSLGHWGEWHVNQKAGVAALPEEPIRDIYVNHYKTYFPDTFLLMRRPFKIASQLNLGLYNDTTADYDETLIWFDWIQNGGEYNQTGEKEALQPMPEAWKYAPIGGEQATRLSDEEVYGTQLEQTLNLVQLSHVTFIGPGGPYDVPLGNDFQNGIDQVLSTIGYRLFIANTDIQTRVEYCNNLKVDITFGNNGIAPIYYNWPTYLYVFDENEEIVVKQKLDIDLRQILPNERVETTDISIPINVWLPNGAYSLGIAIVDPVTDQPSVKLAMINDRDDLIFHLGNFTVDRSIIGKFLSPFTLFCVRQ